jgi:3-oxoacyl-ACP reductase-like protein
MPLAQLSATLQSPEKSSLGKVASSLLTHFFAARMPPGYTQQRARTHLRTAWNLPSGHQSNVLLRSASSSSGGGQQKRLTSDAEAQTLLDETVRKYAAEKGLELFAAAESQEQSGGSSHNVHQHAQQSLEDAQHTARAAKPARNMEHLTALRAARAERDALSTELAELTAELGDAFVELGYTRPVGGRAWQGIREL